MKLRNLIAAFGLCLGLSSTLRAGVIKDTTHFVNIGLVDSFSWAPTRYPTDFRYDIFYYIPPQLKESANVSALIFNHGGGDGTVTRQGSIDTLKRYMPDLRRIADELGIIVVLPSANGLNWGGHTRGLMRELATMMRKELSINPNRLGLSGHSMGGMGITRNYLWTADEFAFYLPMSAGMDTNSQSEQQLNKVFNVPYVHLQGRKDSFPIFVTWCEEQLKRTKELEAAYNTPSKLEIIFHEGNHQYDYNMFKTNLNRLITTAPRNLYQKELWGSVHTVQRTLIENKITFDYDSEARYFWLEVAETDLTTPERTDFHAKIENNVISIDMPVVPKLSKSMNIYLHSKMVDMDKNVDIMLNGKLVQSVEPTLVDEKNMDANDPGFIFEKVVNIKF